MVARRCIREGEACIRQDNGLRCLGMAATGGKEADGGGAMVAGERGAAVERHSL